MSDPPFTQPLPSTQRIPAIDHVHRESSAAPNDGRGPLKANSTPRHRKVASYQIFEATSTQLRDTRQRILQETAGHYLGPMPVHAFLDEFMPYNKDVPEEWKEVKVTDARRDDIATLPQCAEAESYTQFVGALQGWAGLRACEGMPDDCGPPLRFKDSHKFRDRGCLSYSADISVYSGKPFIPRAKEQAMDFANLHTWVELKPTEAYDPFDDGPDEEPSTERKEKGEQSRVVDDSEDEQENEDEPMPPCDPDVDIPADSENPEFAREYEDESQKPETQNLVASTAFPFEETSIKGCDTRAQLASYAGATMATQYRNHLFTVLIAGKRARLIRWERASAVVTKAFDITEDPLILFEFFKRFRQLTLAQRGSNPHVKPANKHDASLARSLLQGQAPELWLGLAGWLFLKERSVDIQTQPFLRFDFGGETFIIPAPQCHERGLSPFGRASRGIAAIRLDKKNRKSSTVCFIKDGWRDIHRDSEHEIYTLLAQHNVRNVAKMLCGGDWAAEEGHPAGDFATTVGHSYASQQWVRKREPFRVRKLQGTLIALDVVGLPLIAFRKTHELVGGLADAMEAYEDALKKAKVMHRDISPHNIILVKTDTGEIKGLLIDWDHSIVLQPDKLGEIGLMRTGTWQFMSISLLRNPKAKHTPPDDRESCFYVLLWICLRHLMHNLHEETLRELLQSFDWIYVKGASHDHSGGDMKLHRLFPYVEDGIIFKDEKLAKLTSLLQDLTATFQMRYEKLPGRYESDEEEAEQTNQKFFRKVKRTLENPEWLIRKLRDTSDQLRNLADPMVEDWTNKVPEKMDQNLPAYLSDLVRSHWHLFGTAAGSGTLKRSTTLGGIQEGVDALDLEQDSERAAKRARGEDE